MPWPSVQLLRLEKKNSETAHSASLTAADVIRKAPIVERSIAVDFRTLLKAHKKAGRLLFCELSACPRGRQIFSGTRRGEDNSWVLASDELEDLEFLVSSHVARDYQIHRPGDWPRKAARFRP